MEQERTVLSDQDRAKLDELVLAIVVAGQGIKLAEILKRPEAAGYSADQVDKSLQRLRKAHKILYFSPVVGWRAVEPKPETGSTSEQTPAAS